MIFLIQSVIAVPAIGDLGVRVTTTNYFLEAFLPADTITLSITALWFVNLILPAMFGSIILVWTNLRRS
jgi:hypothetical protein